MRKPPLLPFEALRRVLAVSRFDGMSLMLIAGGCAIISAYSHDRFGMVAGLLVALAGAIELHGASLLHSIDPRGMRWLIASQLYLLAVILAYAGMRLQHIDLAMFKSVITDDQAKMITDAGMTVDDFLHTAYVLTYGSLAVASVIYQGGMALYYLRRRPAVFAAFEE